MAKRKRAAESASQAVRRIALSYPDVTEGASCNKSAFKARNKSFVFLGESDDSYNVMVKLGDSIDEAEQLAENAPDSFKVGMHGWTTVVFGNDESAPSGLFERWIDESFRLLAPKQLVAGLPEKNPIEAAVRKPRRKKSVRRKTATKTRARRATAKKAVKKKSGSR